MEFDDLSTYMTLSKKTIAKFAGSMYPSSVKEMLNNEDVIADVANAIMHADWRWDSERKGHEGKSKTKYSYRNQCAIWAIKTYMSSRHRKRKVKPASCLDKDETSYMANVKCLKTVDPQDFVELKELSKDMKEIFDSIFNSNLLNEKQKQQIIEYYYNDKTLAKIGQDFGVTREAVRQNIQKGINKIKQYV